MSNLIYGILGAGIFFFLFHLAILIFGRMKFFIAGSEELVLAEFEEFEKIFSDYGHIIRDLKEDELKFRLESMRIGGFYYRTAHDFDYESKAEESFNEQIRESVKVIIKGLERIDSLRLLRSPQDSRIKSLNQHIRSLEIFIIECKRNRKRSSKKSTISNYEDEIKQTHNKIAEFQSSIHELEQVTAPIRKAEEKLEQMLIGLLKEMEKSSLEYLAKLNKEDEVETEDHLQEYRLLLEAELNDKGYNENDINEFLRLAENRT